MYYLSHLLNHLTYLRNWLNHPSSQLNNITSTKSITLINVLHLCTTSFIWVGAPCGIQTLLTKYSLGQQSIFWLNSIVCSVHGFFHAVGMNGNHKYKRIWSDCYCGCALKIIFINWSNMKRRWWSNNTYIIL